MSFDYDKLKSKEGEQSYWATYSDLFMVLSLVFLLLYVTASLRTGTYSIQKNIEYQRVSDLNEDLKQQIKVYNTLKDDYLKTNATNDEIDVYQNLMSKLDLLKEESKNEKEKLRQQAHENEQKEQALNQYQQLVRNIINSNLMAKSRLKRQDQKIEDIKTESKEKITQVREESALRVAQVEEMSASKLKHLKEKNKEIYKNLLKAKTEITSAQQKISEQSRQKDKLVSELSKTKEKYSSQISSLEEKYQSQYNKEKARFEKKLKRQKLSAKAKEKALSQFKAKMALEKEKMQSQVEELNSKIKVSDKELKKAKESLNARKQLAQKIRDNFKKAGIDAQVNEKTGDVVLTFGDEYFDSGKSALKPGMKEILNKSIPVYANSLFQDPNIASKLSFVEIVGFASPTYKGKFVDPQSMKDKDRKAINYNLDLSYYRARNIFDHIFDPKKVDYGEQQKLRSMVKVTGRSFLAEKTKGRGVSSGMSQKEFCKKYDCKKAQRVIIKFDFKN